MFRKARFLFVPALIVFSVCARAQEAYVTGIEDLPLMPGLAQPDGATTQLDKPEGRIVETSAAGLVTPDAVVKYYASALPALGWRQTGPSRYSRDGENLVLETLAQPPGTTVRFSLSPDDSPAR